MTRRKMRSKKKQSNGNANRTRFLIVLCIILLVGGTFTYKSFRDNASVSKQSTERTGKELLAQAQSESKPVYILFHSKTCAPCLEMEKIAKKVTPDFEDKIVFIDVNVYDENEQEIISDFGVQSIPTSVFINKDGKRTSSVGVIPEGDLKAILTRLASGEKLR